MFSVTKTPSWFDTKAWGSLFHISIGITFEFKSKRPTNYQLCGQILYLNLLIYFPLVICLSDIAPLCLAAVSLELDASQLLPAKCLHL